MGGKGWQRGKDLFLGLLGLLGLLGQDLLDDLLLLDEEGAHNSGDTSKHHEKIRRRYE